MKKTTEIIEIKKPEIVVVPIRIVGDTPLIMHKWSEKAKRMMLDKQMKKKTAGHDAKNPVEDFIDSIYWLEGEPQEKTEEGFEAAIAGGARFGFPVTAIKQAAISAAFRSGASKDMASLRGTFFINGEGPLMLGEVKGDAPHMREDMVKIGMGTADIRFRGQFDRWYMNLELKYNKNGQYSLQQIINMVNLGGSFCGIGEWRPEKDGQNGMFHVEGV